MVGIGGDAGGGGVRLREDAGRGILSGGGAWKDVSCDRLARLDANSCPETLQSKHTAIMCQNTKSAAWCRVFGTLLLADTCLSADAAVLQYILQVQASTVHRCRVDARTQVTLDLPVMMLM